MFQGAMVVLMLTVAAAGMVMGDLLLPGIGLVGLWAVALLALYIVTIVAIKRIEPRFPWKAKPTSPKESRSDKAKARRAKADSDKEKQRSLGAIVLHTGVAAGAVAIAATILAFTAEVIAQETGLGDSFVGFMFGGIATTLPELSSTIAAARLREFEMAFSDAFGTNLTSIGLIFLADLLYQGGSILNEVRPFTLFGVLIGSAVTAVYLAGFVARSDRAILRMGYDSHAVLMLSILGFAGLYFLS